MTYNFDVEAATNELADMEREIIAPAPGVITAYDFGENNFSPSPGDLPAAIHLEMGPNTASDIWLGGPLTTDSFSMSFLISSRLLLYEIVADEAEKVSRDLLRDLWGPIVSKFLLVSSIQRLTAASDAIDYRFQMANPSFVRMPWPYASELVKVYWALQYDHFFRVLTN